MNSLPSEIIWHILSFLDIESLSTARSISQQFRIFCDHPVHWRHLRLKPLTSREGAFGMVLWKLSDLKRLIGPHLAHVQTIQIWGVRDAVMRFLLNHCPNLQDLTLCGWATLSDHAFEVSRNLKLRRLELIGATQQTNYIAIDACTLGRLVTYCPDLSEILLGCQVHIHAQTLLRHLQRAPSSRLRSLTLATRRTWSSQHVADLLELCPSLEKVCLLPAAAAGFDPEDMQKTSAQAWVTSHSHVLGLEHPFDKEQALAHNTIIHRSLTAAS